MRPLVLSILLILGFVCLPSFAGDDDEKDLNEVQAIDVRYAAPKGDAEIDAYVKKFVATILERGKARGLAPNQMRVYLQYYGKEPPRYLTALAEALAAKGIKVGEKGEITRWNKEDWDDVFALKRLRIERQQTTSDLLAEINRGGEKKGLPKFADEKLAESILERVNQWAGLHFGLQNGVFSIVTPYIDGNTGIMRSRIQQFQAIRTASLFMVLTAAASTWQILQKYAGDPNVSVIAAVTTAAAWRFFFTYYKDANNARGQMVKFYSHNAGKVVPSFLWSLGNSLIDSIVSSITMQLVLHQGNVTSEIFNTTWLTSFIGAFAKIPVVHWLGPKNQIIQRDTRHAFEEAGHLLALENLPETYRAGLTEMNEHLRKGNHQEALEALEKIMPTATGAHYDRMDNMRITLMSCVRLSNQLWYANAAIDFFFDVLKFASLAGGWGSINVLAPLQSFGIAAGNVNVAYFALGIAGISILYGKFLVSRSHIQGFRDLFDMLIPQDSFYWRIRYRMWRGREVSNEELQHYAHRLTLAIENRRAFFKQLRRSFERITQLFALHFILTDKRLEQVTRFLFGWTQQVPEATISRMRSVFLDRKLDPEEYFSRLVEEADLQRRRREEGLIPAPLPGDLMKEESDTTRPKKKGTSRVYLHVPISCRPVLEAVAPPLEVASQ